jgi:hypothetical protein
MTGSYSISEIQQFVAMTYADPSGRVPQLTILPYAYPIVFNALAQGAQQIGNIQIQANADFICLALKVRAQIGAAQNYGNVTAPFVRMLATDTGSNQQFTNSTVDLVNYATGEDGCFRALPYPRILSGRSAISVQVTNYAPTAETYQTLEILFEGVQVYRLGSGN